MRAIPRFAFFIAGFLGMLAPAGAVNFQIQVSGNYTIANSANVNITSTTMDTNAFQTNVTIPPGFSLDAFSAPAIIGALVAGNQPINAIMNVNYVYAAATNTFTLSSESSQLITYSGVQVCRVTPAGTCNCIGPNWSFCGIPGLRGQQTGLATQALNTASAALQGLGFNVIIN